MRFEPAEPRALLQPPRRRRDRHGRGLRSPLLPPTVPAFRTRAAQFDRAAIAAFAEIDALWHTELTGLDLAVDDVPRMLPRDTMTVSWPDEVTADGPIPLARLIEAGVDAAGRPTRARLILFRRPIELRAHDGDDLFGAQLADILRELLIQQVATYLGVDEETVERGPES